MPLQRRIPKRGFKNFTRVEYQVVNVRDLASLEGEVTPQRLKEAGLIANLRRPVKVLGEGELNGPISVSAHAFSKSARTKIEAGRKRCCAHQGLGSCRRAALRGDGHQSAGEPVPESGAKAEDRLHDLHAAHLPDRCPYHRTGDRRRRPPGPIRRPPKHLPRRLRHVRGRRLSRATIFALGIMPYISASIMFQLLAAVIPTVEKMQKEGEEGRKKLTQWTRYTTVILSVMQGYGYAVFLQSIPGAVRIPGFGFVFSRLSCSRPVRCSSCGWASRSRSAGSATG